MRTREFVLLAGAGVLSACEPQIPADSSSETTMALDGEEVTVEPPVKPEPSAMVPAADDDETPVAQPTLLNPNQVNAVDVAEDRAALTAIPARFLGQWDAIKGSCDPGSDMLLTIRPGTITFYESQRKVTGVRRGRAGIIVTLSMEGEDESWKNEFAMRLLERGVKLTTQKVSDPGTVTTRRRCPAQPTAAQSGNPSTGPGETAPSANAPAI